MQRFVGDLDGGKVGKRNRPPTSCEPCRIRKLRCNRGYPCGTCVQRHKQSSCEYAANANRNKTARSSLGDRLQKLENAVFQIVHHGVTINSGESETRSSKDATTALGDSSQNLSADTSGSLHVHDSQMTYVDSNHWLSILDDIKEVREQFCLSNNQLPLDQQVEERSPERELDLMFSPMPSHDIREILHSLPPRHVCDNLLSLYFNWRFMILPIVHPTKFQKEYEEFWHDSSKTPIIWIGLLFSILSVAAVVRQINSSAEDPIGDTISTDVFRLRTRQCIVLGKYSSVRSYGLETLVLHLQSNFMGLVDSNVSLWFLLGIIIRLAMRLGYHRDSKIHSNISPFEGEMRRRIWANIYQMDVLTSFQLGLPSMIPSECCDTAAPRNLNYSDFSPDTTVLPPSRPLSDHTPVSYTIVKGKVMNVFKKIVSHTQALSPGLPEAMTVLDLELRETYTNIPTGFKMRPINQSFMDTSSTIMNRCNIELLYLKALVVLHRRYLNTDMRSPEYSKSRSVCLEAALRILAIQADIHQSSQPGGRLYKDRWMVSSLTAHDFLLAAMIVCLDLSVLMRTASAKRDEDLGKKLDALQTSHRIWAFASSFSKDANTAAQVLALMIQKIEDLKHAHKSSDSFVIGGNILNTGESSLPYAEPMSDMLDGPENLDWTLLDQYLQNNDAPYDADLFTSNVDFGEEGF